MEGKRFVWPGWRVDDTKRFTVVRIKETPHATFGRLYASDGTEVCVTIERPWVDADADGKRDANVSRIVPGTYKAVKRESPKRGVPVYWLCGVPDVTPAHFPDAPTATTAQIHIANVAGELNGCIGIGSAFGEVKGEPGVTGSRAAFEKFMREAADDEILVTVEDRFSLPPAA